MTTTVADGLLKNLKEIQKRNGLTDPQFAAVLNVSRQLWQATRSGNRPIGYSILQGTYIAFPKLREDVVEVFIQSDTVLHEDPANPVVTPQNKKCGVLAEFVMRHTYWLKRLYCCVKAKCINK